MDSLRPLWSSDRARWTKQDNMSSMTSKERKRLLFHCIDIKASHCDSNSSSFKPLTNVKCTDDITDVSVMTMWVDPLNGPPPSLSQTAQHPPCQRVGGRTAASQQPLDHNSNPGPQFALKEIIKMSLWCEKTSPTKGEIQPTRNGDIVPQQKSQANTSCHRYLAGSGRRRTQRP